MFWANLWIIIYNVVTTIVQRCSSRKDSNAFWLLPRYIPRIEPSCRTRKVGIMETLYLFAISSNSSTSIVRNAKSSLLYLEAHCSKKGWIFLQGAHHVPVNLQTTFLLLPSWSNSSSSSSVSNACTKETLFTVVPLLRLFTGLSSLLGLMGCICKAFWRKVGRNLVKPNFWNTHLSTTRISGTIAVEGTQTPPKQISILPWSFTFSLFVCVCVSQRSLGSFLFPSRTIDWSDESKERN